jgi:low affinity Fe/Cu permease
MKPEQRIRKTALAVTRWIGSPASIVIHTLAFIGCFVAVMLGWIQWNEMLLVVTTIVSLEAIYLSIFIQLTINYTTEAVEDISEDVEEMQEDIGEIQEDVDELQEDVEDISEDVGEITEEEERDEAEEEARKAEQRKTLTDIQSDLRKLMQDISKLQKNQPPAPNA